MPAIHHSSTGFSFQSSIRTFTVRPSHNPSFCHPSGDVLWVSFSSSIREFLRVTVRSSIASRKSANLLLVTVRSTNDAIHQVANSGFPLKVRPSAIHWLMSFGSPFRHPSMSSFGLQYGYPMLPSITQLVSCFLSIGSSCCPSRYSFLVIHWHLSRSSTPIFFFGSSPCHPFTSSILS